MARAPSAAGKTRLARDVAAERLVTLRAALLADTLDVAGRASEALAMDVLIFYTPATAASEMLDASGGRFCLVSQGEGDLGGRMRTAFAHLLDTLGYASAILVGTDIPLLNGAHLAAARGELEASGGVVLGPADDGGYFLIGMTTVHAGLFDQIVWGSPAVLGDTLAAAERHGIAAHVLAPTYDIDTIEDLHRLERDLSSAPPEVGAHVRAWFGAR
jgi:rSAM/selenodomain-associated transferase 1